MNTTIQDNNMSDAVHEPEVKSPADALDENDLELGRMLSIGSPIPYSPATAEVYQPHEYRKIGAGACGAVFTASNTSSSIAYKLGKTLDDSMLWNDYLMHIAIGETMGKFKHFGISIPDCYFFVRRDEEQYFQQHSGLVEAARDTCHMPTCMLATQRIFPLPEPIRTRLIERYCPERAKEEAARDRANEDCLVRVYLGSGLRRGTSAGRFFSLRNFKMHLYQMLEIGLDIQTLAERMAAALAIMHWAAKTDARDVEFVLGRAAKPKNYAGIAEGAATLHRQICTGPLGKREDNIFCYTTDLWVLDFNQVQSVTLNEEGVTRMVEAVKLNDPYFPRPLQESQQESRLWNTFASRYLEVADSLMTDQGADVRQLPHLFIERLIELEKDRQKRLAST